MIRMPIYPEREGAGENANAKANKWMWGYSPPIPLIPTFRLFIILNITNT